MATTEATLYTCPGATECVTSSIVIANRSSSVATFRVAVVEDGSGATATKDYLYFNVAMPASDTFAAKLGITLSGADEIRVFASTASLTFAVFGVELTA